MKNWWERKRTNEITAYPWLHNDVVQRLAQIVKRRMTVVEHGCGGSTLWFAERVKKVFTVESDYEWAKEIERRAPNNVSVIRKSGEIPPGLPECDLLFVDGEHPTRGLYIAAAHHMVKPCGWVVFDNANRPEYARQRANLLELCGDRETFDRNTNFSQFFVTDFYRMPESV